ncbi:unnamed protein product, partial [Diplocarpon coronariae]
GMYMH